MQAPFTREYSDLIHHYIGRRLSNVIIFLFGIRKGDIADSSVCRENGPKGNCRYSLTSSSDLRAHTLHHTFCTQTANLKIGNFLSFSYTCLESGFDPLHRSGIHSSQLFVLSTLSIHQYSCLADIILFRLVCNRLRTRCKLLCLYKLGNWSGIKF